MGWLGSSLLQSCLTSLPNSQFPRFLLPQVARCLCESGTVSRHLASDMPLVLLEEVSSHLLAFVHVKPGGGAGIRGSSNRAGACPELGLLKRMRSAAFVEPSEKSYSGCLQDLCNTNASVPLLNGLVWLHFFLTCAVSTRSIHLSSGDMRSWGLESVDLQVPQSEPPNVLLGLVF